MWLSLPLNSLAWKIKGRVHSPTEIFKKNKSYTTYNWHSDYVRTFLPPLFFFLEGRAIIHSLTIKQKIKFKQVLNNAKAAYKSTPHVHAQLSAALKFNLGLVVTLDLFGVVLCFIAATCWVLLHCWLIEDWKATLWCGHSLHWTRLVSGIYTYALTFRPPGSPSRVRRRQEFATFPHSILHSAPADEYCQASMCFLLFLPIFCLALLSSPPPPAPLLSCSNGALPLSLWRFPVLLCIKRRLKLQKHSSQNCS